MENIFKQNFVVGTKQTLRAIDSYNVKLVIIAEDASTYIKEEILEKCAEKSADIKYISKMSDLGKACGISRNAACAAILKEKKEGGSKK